MPIIDRDLLELSCRDMFFAHWPIEAAALRPQVPRSLTIDTYDGSAWVGVVAFRVHSIQAGSTSVPAVAPFLNLNLRTYVRNGSQSGIYFLSSDIDSPAAAAIGHRLFGFTVYQAKMSQRDRDGTMRFRSERVESEGRRKGFQARYEPIGEVFQAEPGSIEEFLIEQSRYYIAGEPNRSSSRSSPESDDRPVRTGEITRPAHQLQTADADVQLNTLLDDFEDGLHSDDPTTYYCEQWDAGWNPLESAFS